MKATPDSPKALWVSLDWEGIHKEIKPWDMYELELNKMGVGTYPYKKDLGNRIKILPRSLRPSAFYSGGSAGRSVSVTRGMQLAAVIDERDHCMPPCSTPAIEILGLPPTNASRTSSAAAALFSGAAEACPKL